MSSTSFLTSIFLATSRYTIRARPPAVMMADVTRCAPSVLMSATMTTAPRRLSASQRARPIPDAPPVTIATLSLHGSAALSPRDVQPPGLRIDRLRGAEGTFSAAGPFAEYQVGEDGAPCTLE